MERPGDSGPDHSLARVGGTCAILLGIVFAVSAITYLLLPAAQRIGTTANEILPSIVKDGRTLLQSEFWELALIGVLGLAVVPAVSAALGGHPEGWLRWTGTLATLGFAVSAVGNVLSANRIAKTAEVFVAGDASVKAALSTTWRSTLDPYAVWAYGAVGVWVIAVSILSRRRGSFPSALSWVGLLLGIVSVGVMVALLANTPKVIVGLAAAGTVLTLVWYGWLGVVLRRSAAPG